MGLGHCIQVNIAFAVYRFLHTYPHRRVSLEYLPIVASPYYLGILSLPTHIDHTNYIPIIYFFVLPTIIWAPYCVTPYTPGIRGSMQVYAALVCHATTFPSPPPPLFFLFKGKKISSC